jgi:hypothetical protein
MTKFIYKNNLRRERMPEWLKYITDYTLEEFNSLFPIGLKFDFEMLEWSIKDDLRMLGKDNVTTELVADEGQTVIFIKRSGHTLVSIYFK